MQEQNRSEQKVLELVEEHEVSTLTCIFMLYCSCSPIISSFFDEYLLCSIIFYAPKNPERKGVTPQEDH